MKYLVVCTFLLAAIAECLAQEINVGEEPTTREVCMGSNLTMRCSGDNVVGGSHVWTISNTSVNRAALTLGEQLPNIPGFPFSLTSTTNMLMSTVQFTIEMPHTVTCIAAGVGNLQTNLSLYGMSCPTINPVLMNNDTSVGVTLHGTFRCTREYSATIIGGTDTMSSDLNEAERNASMLNVGTFNLTNSTLDSRSSYNVNVTLTFDDNLSVICTSVFMLPTNPTSMSITSSSPVTTATTTSAVTEPTTSPMPVESPNNQLIVIVVPVIVGVLVIIIIVIIIAAIGICVCKSKERTNSSKPVAYDDFKPDQPDPHDQLPTYQDPKAIQREEAPDGSVYSMVDKKPKGSKKKSEKKDEMPMYSVVDKNNKDPNSQEGLVYTEVSVQSTSRSSRSRPPPPPGVAQLDANESVVYSTVETPQQRQ